MKKSDEFYSIYKKKYEGSRYKYLAYRKAEEEFKQKHGYRKYASFDSFRVTMRKKIKSI